MLPLSGNEIFQALQSFKPLYFKILSQSCCVFLNILSCTDYSPCPKRHQRIFFLFPLIVDRQPRTLLRLDGSHVDPPPRGQREEEGRLHQHPGGPATLRRLPGPPARGLRGVPALLPLSDVPELRRQAQQAQARVPDVQNAHIQHEEGLLLKWIGPECETRAMLSDCCTCRKKKNY